MVYDVEMRPVQSSNVAAIGYRNGGMLVKFHNGGMYYYHNVPNELFWRMLRASSKGRFLHQFIKNQPQYWCEKIG